MNPAWCGVHLFCGVREESMWRGKLMAVGFVLCLCLTAARAGLAADVRPVKSLLEMRREHVVVQKFDLSCGAAALATLLNYQHGDPVSERDIAKELIRREEYLQNPALVNIRQGFSLLDLKRYVEQRGYEGIGYGKLTLEDLIERAPVIVPIRTHGYNHFVIFRGLWGARVLLADPAWGNRTMSVDAFEQVWLNYPDFGRVGFVVVTRREGGDVGPRLLAPRPEEFLSLK
jgi:uncharacterized protein